MKVRCLAKQWRKSSIRSIKTRYLPLILCADGKVANIYLDGSHAVHHDMKGHTSMYVTEGKGALVLASTRCKLKTPNSTETEIIVVGEKLPWCIWYLCFRIEQELFLPDKRAGTITKQETNLIFQWSFDYIVGLMEFNLYVFQFQLNYHLFQGF